ncbi:MAG: alpha/beta fold hydrolase [Methylobacterium mesophilicum]|nr:alpha/beta fold hydrolase [Methylobacterium mesophilicum]
MPMEIAKPRYTELPPRASRTIAELADASGRVAALMRQLGSVQARPADADRATKVFDSVSFTHRLVDAPADYTRIPWHYVECGAGEPIVFLHGLPDSWFLWHHQMASLSATHRCIAIDLKGYGQSYKGLGDYTQEGTAEQIVAMLEEVGITRFNLVSHDRGTAQADFIVANHPDRVLRYGRGEQLLYHFNPQLAAHDDMVLNAPYTGTLADPARFVASAYASLTVKPVPDEELRRIVQEFSYPGIDRAVPRYYAAGSKEQEWLARRSRLLSAWTSPVLLIQGYDSKTQPREFYEDARAYIPNAAAVEVRLVPGGHYWTHESPNDTTAALHHLLAMPSGA